MKRCIGFLLVVAAGHACAGYAELAPPPNWTSTAGASPTYRLAANESWTSTQTVRTNAALNIGGRNVTMPAALRISAANAPRFLAARVGAGMLGGPIGMGLTLAALLALPAMQEWWQDSGFSWDQAFNGGKGRWIKTTNNNVCTATVQNGVTGSGNTCSAAGAAAYAAWQPTYNPYGPAASALDFTCAVLPNGYCNIYYKGTTSTLGSFSAVMNSQGGSVAPADYFTEVKPYLDVRPIPGTLPSVLPQFDWPVDPYPIINPSADPVPLPRPALVPVGDPVPVPNSNPATQSQPVVRVTPSPVPEAPWRVNVNPEQVINPVGTPPVVDPALNPVATPAPTTQPRTEEEGLCDKYPDILACQKPKLKPLQPIELTTKTVPMSITPDTGWGAGGTCPAPRQVTLSGRPFSFSWQAFCDLAAGIRPLLIGFAWLAAAMSFLGLARKD